MADLNGKSTSVEFYNTAIVAMLTQIGESMDIAEVDRLRDEVHRLTNRMADAAFNDVANRTFYLKSLVADLQRITSGAPGPAVAPWITKLNGVVTVAQGVVNAATGVGG
jgi:hypothetical protein